MIAAALLLALGQAAAAPSPGADFADRVKAYTTFTTAHCAPELVEPYILFNRRRDAAFARSLKGTALDETYRTAVSEQRAQDEGTVFECSGPPPPPPPPGTTPPPPPDRRTFVIADTQKRLRGAADELPTFFDKGDALFARMVAERDKAVAKGVHP